jgi:hypothetical protein
MQRGENNRKIDDDDDGTFEGTKNFSSSSSVCIENSSCRVSCEDTGNI